MSNSDLEYDEDDEYQAEMVAESLVPMLKTVFPKKLLGKLSLRSITPVHLMDESQVEDYLSLVDENLGSFYIAKNGEDWKEEKLEEMMESGVIYIAYGDTSSNLAGFLSLKLVNEFSSKSLYLYEIHISPKYQKSGLGSKLITGFHDASKLIKLSVNNPDIKYSGFFDLSRTSLTVFSNNRALEWYLKLGYFINEDSPRNKTLRNKVVKPSYYMLSRYI